MEFEITSFDISKYKNIVILSGAGVSTNSGIPDYRSATGIFKQMNLSDPEAFFSRGNPHAKEAYEQFSQIILKAPPTSSHKFAKWLNDNGVLRRVYTQNIDGLYQKAGLPKEKLVEVSVRIFFASCDFPGWNSRFFFFFQGIGWKVTEFQYSIGNTMCFDCINMF